MRRIAIVALASLVAGGVAAAAPAKTPHPAADQRVVKKYRAAMKRGRIATRRKQLAAAIKAFGAALAARPNDAEALAERGFARMLDQDDAGARADLIAAEAHAAGATLHGQIWFNLGLLAEQRGDVEAARDAFGRSNRLHPTRAALEKLGGVPGCGITIERTRVTGTIYPSWKAAAIGLDALAEHPDGLPPPADDDEARTSLCGDDGCAGAGPWRVTTVDAKLNGTDHVVIALPRGRLLAFDSLGGDEGGWCPANDELTIEGGDPLRVRVVTETTAIGDGEGECFDSAVTEIDRFFDVAAGVQVLAIERPQVSSAEYAEDEDDFHQPVTLARTADGVALTGGGCDQTIRF